MVIYVEDNITVFTLKEKLTSISILLKRANMPITLDFSQVKKLDSAIISYIFHIIREVSCTKRGISLYNMPDAVISLAQLYEVEGLLQPYLQQVV